MRHSSSHWLALCTGRITDTSGRVASAGGRAGSSSGRALMARASAPITRRSASARAHSGATSVLRGCTACITMPSDACVAPPVPVTAPPSSATAPATPADSNKGWPCRSNASSVMRTMPLAISLGISPRFFVPLCTASGCKIATSPAHPTICSIRCSPAHLELPSAARAYRSEPSTMPRSVRSCAHTESWSCATPAGPSSQRRAATHSCERATTAVPPSPGAQSLSSSSSTAP
mmetsp:Transcript_4767/g.19039  ORF Transcript_4767/g.19039 Transcript_4767/m.19039 type:complete len:233 (-) Transcript_4767:1026-1724(-)